MPDRSLFPLERIRTVNQHGLRADGKYVLYWMIAFRRPHWNFALQRAVELARQLKKPLLVLEPLNSNYRWACDRFHRFVMQGMVDNRREFEAAGVTYYPYLEPAPQAGRGLLRTLAESAAAVVTDDFPCFFLPRIVEQAGRTLPVQFEAVDSNGIIPLRSPDRTFPLAHTFRRYLQHVVLEHLQAMPSPAPLKQLTEKCRVPLAIPADVRDRWPAASLEDLSGSAQLASLPIDHSVASVAAVPGGWVAAEERLQRFLGARLNRYIEERNEPQADGTSGLSPYLHFGHISSHRVVSALLEREKWTPDRVAPRPTGSAQGWWGASSSAEAFLDQIITWRELGYNMTSRQSDYDQFDSLPPWAVETLEEHAADERLEVYDLSEFERAATHDPLWNAAQRQLVREGTIHNYLRMLWGKKILHWSATPRQALDIMIELNNKFALDGRNPNSYSGIFWTLGRYDRAWGPERPIFGKIRYMTSDNTARKFDTKGYVAKYGPTERRLFAD